MKTNWKIENNEQWPTDGFYLVEVQMCDIPDQKEIFIDEYKNGYWVNHRQFVNKYSEIEGWIPSKIKPPHNLGVLVFIPDEDNHKTSGMWDVSESWVLLDEYRTPEKKITHWAMMPEDPEQE